MKIIYSDIQKFNTIIDNFKKDWLNSLHLVSDFDRTLTKAFSAWKKRSSLISVLRSEWYLWEKYSKKAYELFDYYNPIEVDPKIDIETKIKEMSTWRNKHLQLLVDTWLTRKDIETVIDSRTIEFREWVLKTLWFLSKNNVPLVIISANWLGADSTNIYFKRQWVLSDNVHIISNSFVWDDNWKAIWYDKRVVHTFNKWEVILKEFPEIYKDVRDRRNVILLWDSLWDPNMADGFPYDNILKIWFLNDKEDELLKEYKKIYDVVVTWDGDFSVVNDVIEEILSFNNSSIYGKVDFSSLKNELKQMYELDQNMRKNLNSNKSNWDNIVDIKNTKRLKEIIKQIWVLTISKVWKNASMYAWLLVQHADHDINFQENYLELMKLEPKNEIHQDNIAYLEDRVAVAKWKKQIYWTQFFIDKDWILKPNPIKDRKNLEKRRKKMWIGPFSEYEKLMSNNN